jgi:hypothetical protein
MLHEVIQLFNADGRRLYETVVFIATSVLLKVFPGKAFLQVCDAFV